MHASLRASREALFTRHVAGRNSTALPSRMIPLQYTFQECVAIPFAVLNGSHNCHSKVFLIGVQ